jgi:hypothetical protein
MQVLILGGTQVDVTKATSEGLVCRPLSETIHDTLTWAQRRPEHYVWQAGLSRQNAKPGYWRNGPKQKDAHEYQQKSIGGLSSRLLEARSDPAPLPASGPSASHYPLSGGLPGERARAA